jgi:hypothetical protein
VFENWTIDRKIKVNAIKKWSVHNSSNKTGAIVINRKEK